MKFISRTFEYGADSARQDGAIRLPENCLNFVWVLLKAAYWVERLYLDPENYFCQEGVNPVLIFSAEKMDEVGFDV